MDLVISFIGRCEDVQLDLMGPLYVSIGSIDRLQAPLLKHFATRLDYETEEFVEPLLSMLSTSPHLIDLSWSNQNIAKYPIHKAELLLPWSRLTRVRVDYALDVEECLIVLHLCPSLIECTFPLIAFHLPPPLPVHQSMSIVHQHLRVLSLGSLHEQTYDLLDYLTLPVLSTFALGRLRDDHHRMAFNWPRDSFKAFLSRSGTVKTFRVQTAILSSLLLVELLHLLPTLTELSIEGDEFDPLEDTLFHTLTYGEKAEMVLCPKLQVITLGGDVLSSEGTLVKMLESRSCSNPSQSRIAVLQKAVIVLTGEWDASWEDILEELEAMRVKGFDVVVERVIHEDLV